MVMAAPCPICGLVECQHYLGQGAANANRRQFFYTERDIINRSGPMLRLTKAVYLDANNKMVAADDPAAAFLLGGKGALISEADAKRLGVSDTEVADIPLQGLIRSPFAAVPVDPTDDSLYNDQSVEGKAARAAARAQHGLTSTEADLPEKKAVVAEVAPDEVDEPRRPSSTRTGNR